MSDTPNPKLGDMVPVDVRIINVNEIPAKYFLHDEISEALRRVIRSDVVVHGNPVPPGVEAVFSRYTPGVANKRVALAASDLKHTLQRGLPGVIFIWLVIGVGTLIAVLVWRALNG